MRSFSQSPRAGAFVAGARGRSPASMPAFRRRVQRLTSRGDSPNGGAPKRPIRDLVRRSDAPSDHSSTRDNKRRPSSALVDILFAGQALGSVGGAAVFGFLPLYAQSRFQADVASASLVPGAYFAAGAVASLAAGEIADRYGRRLVIVAGLACGAISAVGLCLASTLPLMMVGAGAAGFFDSLPYPAFQAVVADVVAPEERKLVYGRQYQAFGVGWLIGPAAAGILIGQLGFGPTYLLAAAMLLVATLLVAFWLPETRPRTHGNDADPLSSAAGEPLPSGYGEIGPLLPRTQADRLGQTALSASSPMRSRRLLAFILLCLLTTGAYIQLFTVFPAEGLARNHLGLGDWGAILALNGAMILIGQGLVSRNVGRLQPPHAIAVGVGLWILGFAGLSTSLGPGWIFVEMVVFTLGEMIIFPLQPAIVAEVAPPKDRARYQAVLALSSSLGNAVAPVAGGAAIAALGPVWWLGMAAFAGCLAVAYAWLGSLAASTTTLDGTPSDQASP